MAGGRENPSQQSAKFVSLTQEPEIGFIVHEIDKSWKRLHFKSVHRGDNGRARYVKVIAAIDFSDPGRNPPFWIFLILFGFTGWKCGGSRPVFASLTLFFFCLLHFNCSSISCWSLIYFFLCLENKKYQKSISLILNCAQDIVSEEPMRSICGAFRF